MILSKDFQVTREIQDADGAPHKESMVHRIMYIIIHVYTCIIGIEQYLPLFWRVTCRMPMEPPTKSAWYTSVGQDIKSGFVKLTKNIETSLVSAGDSIGEAGSLSYPTPLPPPSSFPLSLVSYPYINAPTDFLSDAYSNSVVKEFRFRV